jgi:hypothetical protein
MPSFTIITGSKRTVSYIGSRKPVRRKSHTCESRTHVCTIQVLHRPTQLFVQICALRALSHALCVVRALRLGGLYYPAGERASRTRLPH